MRLVARHIHQTGTDLRDISPDRVSRKSSRGRNGDIVSRVDIIPHDEPLPDDTHSPDNAPASELKFDADASYWQEPYMPNNGAIVLFMLAVAPLRLASAMRNLSCVKMDAKRFTCPAFLHLRRCCWKVSAVKLRAMLWHGYTVKASA